MRTSTMRKIARKMSLLHIEDGNLVKEQMFPVSFTFWKSLKIAICVWISLSFIFIHVYLSAIVGVVYSRNKKYISYARYPLIIGISVSCGGLLMTIYTIIYRRKRLSRLMNELITILDIVESRKVRNLVFRFKMALFLMFSYALWVSFVGLYFSFKSTREDRLFVIFFYCHGFCDPENFPDWLGNALLSFDLFTYPLAVQGGCMLIVMFYSFCAISVVHVVRKVKRTLKDFDFEESANSKRLKFIRLQLLEIGFCVDKINEMFQNIILIWYSVTVFSTCHNMTIMIKNRSVFCNLRASHFYIPLYFQDLINCTALTLIAARVAVEIDEIIKMIPSLSEKAIPYGKCPEIRLMYTQISAYQIALRIGGCFVITKKLLLSFFGAGVTYGFMYIQFDPDVIKKLQGVMAESKSLSNDTCNLCNCSGNTNATWQ